MALGTKGQSVGPRKQGRISSSATSRARHHSLVQGSSRCGLRETEMHVSHPSPGSCALGWARDPVSKASRASLRQVTLQTFLERAREYMQNQGLWGRGRAKSLWRALESAEVAEKQPLTADRQRAAMSHHAVLCALKCEFHRIFVGHEIFFKKCLFVCFFPSQPLNNVQKQVVSQIWPVGQRVCQPQLRHTTVCKLLL